MNAVRVVSLLPLKLEERLERLLAEGFTGSVEVHISAGSIETFKVIETVRIDGHTRIST